MNTKSPAAHVNVDAPADSRGTHASARYELSFSAGTLMSHEAVVIAPIYLECRNWETTRTQAVKKNLVQARARLSTLRITRETIKRLSVLTDPELTALPSLPASDRSHLMWVAACRRYAIIGEFAEEVLRERFLTLGTSVTYDDYDAFWKAKTIWHGELHEVRDSTYRKLRQTVFSMMREAELLDRTDTIQPALLSPTMAAFLNSQLPSDIRFFPARGLE